MLCAAHKAANETMPFVAVMLREVCQVTKVYKEMTRQHMAKRKRGAEEAEICAGTDTKKAKV